jgi:flagellar hook-basal body complex protein FliE
MLPISSIQPALPMQSLLPRQGIPVSEALQMRAPGVDPALPLSQPSPVSPSQGPDQSFGSLLGRLVEDVNARQNAAADAVRGLQAGGDVSLHQAMIAMEEASVSFQLMVEVRNKLLESYQELMRMQI